VHRDVKSKLALAVLATIQRSQSAHAQTTAFNQTGAGSSHDHDTAN